MLLLEVHRLPHGVQISLLFVLLIRGWWKPIDEIKGQYAIAQILLLALQSLSDELFVLSSKMTNLVIFFNFISGSRGSFSRKVISYKSDFNTVVVLFWKLESSLQKNAATQAIFKNESFRKGVMLVPS